MVLHKWYCIAVVLVLIAVALIAVVLVLIAVALIAVVLHSSETIK